MTAPLTLRELRHMANESVIVAEAKRDRQEAEPRGRGSAHDHPSDLADA